MFKEDTFTDDTRLQIHRFISGDTGYTRPTTINDVLLLKNIKELMVSVLQTDMIAMEGIALLNILYRTTFKSLSCVSYTELYLTIFKLKM